MSQVSVRSQIIPESRSTQVAYATVTRATGDLIEFTLHDYNKSVARCSYDLLQDRAPNFALGEKVAVFVARNDETGDREVLDVILQSEFKTGFGRIDRNGLKQFCGTLTAEHSNRQIKFFAINLRWPGRSRIEDLRQVLKGGERVRYEAIENRISTRSYELRAIVVEQVPEEVPSSSNQWKNMAASDSEASQSSIRSSVSSLIPPVNKAVLFPEERNGCHGIVWMLDNQLEYVIIWDRTLGKVRHQIETKQRRMFQSSFAVGAWVSFDAKFDGNEWCTVSDLNVIAPKLKFTRYPSDFDVAGHALVAAVFEDYGYLWSDAIGRIKVTDFDQLCLLQSATAVSFVAKRIFSNLAHESDIAFEVSELSPYTGGLTLVDARITSTEFLTRHDGKTSSFSGDTKVILAEPLDCDPSGYLRTPNEQLYIVYAPALVSEYPACTHRALLVGSFESAPFDCHDDCSVEIEAVNRNSDQSSDDGDLLGEEETSSDDEQLEDVDDSTESDREIANIFAKANHNELLPLSNSSSTPALDESDSQMFSSIREDFESPSEAIEQTQHGLSFLSEVPSDGTFITACESLPLVDWSRELEDVDSQSDTESEINYVPPPPPTKEIELPDETFFDMLQRRQKASSSANLSVGATETASDALEDQQLLLPLVADVHQLYVTKMMRLASGENQALLPGASARVAPVVEYMDAWMVTGPLPLTNLLGCVVTDPVLGRMVLEGAGIDLVVAAVDCLTNQLDYDTLCQLVGPGFRDDDDNDLMHWPQGRNKSTTSTQTVPRAELSIFRRLQAIDGFVETAQERHPDLFQYISSWESV